MSFNAAWRRTATALSGVLAVLGLVSIMSLSATASATPDPYPPLTGCAVSSTTSTAAVGGKVHVTGSGFPANSTVSLTLKSGTSLGTVTTDANGSFKTTVSLPSSVTSGQVSIRATSGKVSCSAAGFGVSPQSTHRTQPGQTASTGFAAISATIVALVLLGGGAAFIVIGRKRRSA